MFYFYIEKDNKIIASSLEKEEIKNLLEQLPDEGLGIKETPKGYTIHNFKLVTFEEKNELEAKKEREELDKLSMTRGDVFEALILAKGLGKAQLRAMVEQAELDNTAKALYLNRFDEALEFYRGYPIFNLLGEQLNITSQMLDEFFKTKDYKALIKETEPEEPETEETDGAGKASDTSSNQPAGEEELSND